MRGAASVAGFELARGLRSRAAIGVVLVYVIVSAGMCFLMTATVAGTADTLRNSAGVDMTSQELLESALSESVEQLVDKPGLQRGMLGVSPVALFFGWTSLSLIPLLVLLTSAASITGEIATGAARFALVRVDRASWILGKYAGQLALTAIGLAFGAVAAWLVCLIRLPELAGIEALVSLLRVGFRVLIFAALWLGIYMGASLFTRRPMLARLLCLAIWVGIGVATGIVAWMAADGAPALGEAASWLTPRRWRLYLWSDDLLPRAAAFCACLAAAALSLGVGFSWFRTRDA